MKRSAIFMLMAFLLTQSFCYLNTTDNSRVRMNLKAPDAAVTALHVAVYDGSPDNLLLYQVFRPDEIVDLEVPSGPARIFAVWAETTSGTAKYYGVSDPVDLGSDNEEVSLKMLRFSDSSQGKTIYNPQDINPTLTVTWNTIYGADNYSVVTNGDILLCNGPETYCAKRAAMTGSGSILRSFSSKFNLTSEGYTL